MDKTERDELRAAAREIEAQDARVGRLFLRLIDLFPAASTAQESADDAASGGKSNAG